MSDDSGQVAYDMEPKYSIKEVAEMLEMSAYAIRYYDNIGLIPALDRTEGNIRMFSDYSIGWLKLVHCLRTTGLPVEEVKHYIELCLVGDSTIEERAQIIFRQEKVLRKQIRELKKQMEVLKYKKAYYENLLEAHHNDIWNPVNSQQKRPRRTVVTK